MATTSNHYFVILCGGSGPRLWPLSRSYQPKQFLKLFNKKTLLEQTLIRAQKVCPSKNIFIVSNQKYQNQIESIVGKKIPSSNFIYEPTKKNTAMAIILTLSHIYQKNPKAIITTTPSDHYIQKNISFKKNIRQAFKLAAKHPKIVTIGVKPTFNNPSFGYLVPQHKSGFYYHISHFIEKPDVLTAEKLIQKKSFWNTDIHTFSISTMLDEFKNLQPIYFNFFETLIKNSNPKEIKNIYQKSPNLNINQAISEKSKNIFMIPASFDWSDVGEWKSIYKKLKTDSQGHAIIDDETKFLSLDSKNCLINGSSKKLIGLVGISNLAIIDTPDSLLICNLDKSATVRDLVGLMVKNKKFKNFFLRKNEK